MKRLFALFLLLCPFVAAQQEVNLSDRPEAQSYTKFFHYTNNVLDYSCVARSPQPSSTISVSTISNANPGIATATAHGIPIVPPGTTGAHIIVNITGATGGWTGINGIHVVYPITANTFGLDVDTSSFGAWGAQSIAVTTRAPLITKPIWAVRSFVSDSSGNLGLVAYAADSSVNDIGNLNSGTGGKTCTAPGAYQ